MTTVEDNAGEAVEPKEPVTQEPQEGGDDESKEPSKDPLDAIEDEGVRNEMKRLRAIDNRTKKKAEEDPEPAKAPEPNNYATKDDLKVLATNEAKKLVAPEVLEAWDELTKIPLGGYDPLDATSMAKNMEQRFKLFEVPAGDDPTKDLTSSPNMPPSSAPKDKKPASKPLPGYKEPAQPDDWYPGKE